MSEQIVVGVDGSEAAENALIWAAETASRDGAHLVIAHGDSTRQVEPSPGTGVDYHHQLLREAVAVAVEVSGACNISTVLRAEHPSQLLLELSQTADVVVVGSRGVGAVAGTLLGSVAHKVAAHARCAVVVVPEGWRSPSAEKQRPVAVGVSASESGQQALEFAFSEAERRGVPLVAVRSWAHFDWTIPVADFTAAGHDEVRHREQEQLNALIDEVWRRHPAVEVDIELSSETLFSALHGAAERADLLVIGCRNADHLFSRLGIVGMRLLHSSPCPVVIVGQPTALAGDGERAELAGQS
ncbi:MAG TPA: universal stress protein [Jatrophihabitantaceae bacterium]|jgi:nucleotide-binding universal stress UspA family protein